MEPTVRVGRVLGIELHLGYSWFLIFIFATIVMAMQFDANFPDWPPLYQFFWGLAMSLLFFASILGHEIAHSLVALHYNIRVQSIRLHIFGGWSRLGRPPKTPVEEFTIAIAGPLCSLMFACLFALLWKVSRQSLPALSLLTGQLAWINLVLAIFNILPGFPLDGGLVMRATLWYLNGEYTVATRIASYSGQILAAIFMTFGLFLFINIGLAGLWFLVIGYNLFSSSRAQLKDSILKENFKAFKVGDLALQQLPQIGSKVNVQEFLDSCVFGSRSGCHLVVDESVAVGLVTPGQANTIEEHMCAFTSVNQVMTPLERLEMVDPETDVIRALELMDCTETAQLPVVYNRQLQGFISRESLVNFIRTRFEYGTHTS